MLVDDGCDWHRVCEVVIECMCERSEVSGRWKQLGLLRCDVNLDCPEVQLSLMMHTFRLCLPPVMGRHHSLPVNCSTSVK